jgi:hypothetical protein
MTPLQTQVPTLMIFRSISLSTDVGSKRDEKRLRQVRKRFVGFVAMCFLISSSCAVFEVFALLNIQFCDGEDLIVLYWSFWGFFQVGSIIAIFGVILNLWIAIADVHTPSWAVALGTPVLVFAALHWILQAVWRQAWLKFTGRHSEDESPGENNEEEGSFEDEERRELEYEEKKDKDRWASRAYVSNSADGDRSMLSENRPTIAPQQSGGLLTSHPFTRTSTRRSSI